MLLSEAFCFHICNCFGFKLKWLFWPFDCIMTYKRHFLPDAKPFLKWGPCHQTYILRACIVAGLIFGIDTFYIPKLELAIIYNFVMFLKSMLSILVLNDIQIPQNLLKFMDNLNSKTTYACSFNWKSVWDPNQMFINSFRPQQICGKKFQTPAAKLPPSSLS